MKIIADNKIPFLQGVFEPFCDIEYVAGNEIDSASLKDVEILIIRTRTICNKELLEGTSVKYIASATIGYDHIDTDYCSENNISWINAPGCNSGAVQQWFMSALLYYAKIKSIDLTKKTLGVIGVGNVGRKIVKFAEAIGMSVILNDPPREKVEGSCIFRGIDTILRECDIITFHVPLITTGIFKTYHMVNDELLSRINSETILINSSRGEVFDTKNVSRSKEAGNIEGLFLDVWEDEPYVSDILLQNTDIATPHIAGYSIEGKANGTAAVVQAVGAYLDLPLDAWNPEEIDAPIKQKIQVNCKGKTLQDVITELVLESYSIIDDDIRLRRENNKFELLRSEYNFRHEPTAWEVELINGNNAIKVALIRLGFKIL